MTIAIAALFGATWRVMDGMDHSQPAGNDSKWYWGMWLFGKIRLPLMFFAVLFYLTPIILAAPTGYHAMVFGGCVTVIAGLNIWSLQSGYSDWSCWSNAFHHWPSWLIIPAAYTLCYGALPAMTLFALAVAPLLAGLAHPVSTALGLHTRIAEGIAGGVLLGSVATL